MKLTTDAPPPAAAAAAAPPVLPPRQYASPKRSAQGGRRMLLVPLAALGFSLLVLTPLALRGIRRDAQTLSAGPALAVEIAAAPGMRFSPDEIHVPAGASVQVTFANHDPSSPHTFQTFGQYRDANVVLWPGDQRVTGFIAAEKPGRYPFICSVRGHEEAGMVGTIVVEPADTTPAP